MPRYFVTFGGFDSTGRPAPVAIDTPMHTITLSDALAHACWLVSQGREYVAVRDDAGNSISGDDLAGCCKGTKLLSHDLRASVRVP